VISKEIEIKAYISLIYQNYILLSIKKPAVYSLPRISLLVPGRGSDK
jgi:hypothetical protein